MWLEGVNYCQIENGFHAAGYGGEFLKRNVPVLLTVAILIIGILSGAAILYLPEANAPQIRLTLHDADGMKSVSVGETAEYVIKVQNLGGTRGHVDLSLQGEAEGWASVISHESLNLGPKDWQNVHLFVTPETEEAAPWIDVNVIATRADNITITATTTFLIGTMEIRESGEKEWTTYLPDTEIGEGDDLRTGPLTYSQITFQNYLRIVFMPFTQMHVIHSNSEGDTKTFWLVLKEGEAIFSLNLPGGDSGFMLDTNSGAVVQVNDTGRVVFTATSEGYVRVFAGTVSYEAPPGRGPAATRAGEEVTGGSDSSGNTFDYSILSYPNALLNGVVTTSRGATMGFENSGNFITDGSFHGYVLRHADTDDFYLYGNDASYAVLQVFPKISGLFDITFTQNTPDRVTFGFRNVDTTANTLTFMFQKGRTSIFSPAFTTYDLDITNSNGDMFVVTDVDLEEGNGNGFSIQDINALGDHDSAPVIFELDVDGDGDTDRAARITTGATGDEIVAALEKEDVEESDYLWVGVFFIIIILAFLIIFVIFSKKRPPSSRFQREEEFRRKRAELLGLTYARYGEMPQERKKKELMEDEAWDEIIPPSPPITPSEPEGSIIDSISHEPVVPMAGPSERLEWKEREAGAAERTKWKEREVGAASERAKWEERKERELMEIEVPPQVTSFKQEIEKPEYQAIPDMLKEEPDEIKFTIPEEMKEKVKKRIEDIDDWWDEWNDELDEILKM